ncbi:MAG: FHA domain-containing protein, partial [Actinomycetota bacterium]|nr:FHA domain-containing protein [Actinomycetota bacterium]
MELLLEAHFPGEPAALDVRVEVDETDSVGQLVAAIASFARARGVAAPDGAAGQWTEDGAELPSDATVGAAELVNGAAIYVGAPPPAARPGGAGTGIVFLDVASGPETGRFVSLGQGSHRVGRDESCDVVLDDPTLSRHHLTIHVHSQDEVVVEPNPDATNGTFAGDRQMTAARAVEPRELVHAGATSFAVRPADVRRAQRRDLLGQIPFNRVPYRRTVVNERVFPPVPAPPARVQPTKLALAAAFIPLLGGVGLAVWMGRPQFLIFALLSPVALIVRHFSDKRAGRRSYGREKQTFLHRIEARVSEIDTAIEAERRERLTAAPDLAALGRQVEYLQMRLWERHRDAADFLSLRLGLGTVESMVEASIDRGGDPELREAGAKALARQTTVSSVPIVADMSTLHTFGLFGEGAVVDALGRSLTLQAACLHSPEDLVVVAALPRSLDHELDWLKWLPHTRAVTSPLDGPHLASGPDETRNLLLRLLGVAGERLQRKTGAGPPQVWPRILLVLHEGADPDRAVLAQLLDVAPGAGMATIWLGRDELLLPRHSWATFRCVDPLVGAKSALQYIDPSLSDREVEVETASLEAAHRIATALAPVRDASAAT